MFVHHQLFDDADQHAAALQGWDQRYEQIGSGVYRSVVKQAAMEGMQIFHEAANRRVVQRGWLPPGQTVFGIPLAGEGAFAFGGVRIEHGGFVMARGGCPFEMHSPDRMSLIAVVLDSDCLQVVTDAAGIDRGDALFRREVVDIPDAACVRAGLRIATLLERLLARPADFDGAPAQRALRAEVGDALVDLLTYRLPASTGRLTYACRADIVRRVHDYVIGHPEESLDIQSLCSRLRVSRRTMQNSFQSVVQTGPLTYVRSLRLAQVRRLLLDTRRADVPVSAAAARWGFAHLGRFASAYKAQFGELPSQTEQKGARSIAVRQVCGGAAPSGDGTNPHALPGVG